MGKDAHLMTSQCSLAVIRRREHGSSSYGPSFDQKCNAAGLGWSKTSGASLEARLVDGAARVQRGALNQLDCLRHQLNQTPRRTPRMKRNCPKDRESIGFQTMAVGRSKGRLTV
jgi:hypothetical protein